MEILFRWCDVDPLAGAATVRVRHGMQRLMDVADEMDEKSEIAGDALFVPLRIHQLLRANLIVGERTPEP
jgi:hypothetical protein